MERKISITQDNKEIEFVVHPHTKKMTINVYNLSVTKHHIALITMNEGAEFFAKEILKMSNN
jgi:hypothetical protein